MDFNLLKYKISKSFYVFKRVVYAIDSVPACII